MKKLPYSEGTLFLVPLRGGGFARGLVARATLRGKVLFGYFWGPRLSSQLQVTSEDVEPGKAILRAHFSDLGLIKGPWPIISLLPNWNRSHWPMPDFVRQDPLGRLKPILVHYADDDPNKVEYERFVDDAGGLPTDGLYGAEALEITLSRLVP